MRLPYLVQALPLLTVASLLTACGGDDDSDNSPIIADVTPPLLTISNDFKNGTTNVAAVFASGQLRDTGGIESFTYQINDQLVQPIVLDAEGRFDTVIPLTLGANNLTLIATDMTGNITTSTKTLYLGNTIAAGGAHTGAIENGQLYGWGRNNLGQTGLGKTTKLSENNTSNIQIHPDTPMLMSHVPDDLVSLSFNQNFSLALSQNGEVYSWGDDKYGQLGRGNLGRDNCSRTEDCRLDIGMIASIDDAIMISAGYNHSLILTQDGSVWAMGENTEGQLGNGTTDNSDTPVKVDFSAAQDMGHIVQVVTSASSSYALDDKGQVWGWGSDSYANLGRGETCTTANNCINKNTKPVRISVIQANDNTDTDTDTGIEIVTQLAAGRDHVLALTNKDVVYGWGLNASSQVGYNGENFAATENAWDDYITIPTKLPWFIDKEVSHVYANGNASYVVLDNGKVYPWGMFGETNSAGRTIYNDLDEPTDTLPSLTNINSIAMGTMHLIAKDKEDNLYTWGWSFEGSIGNMLATHIWMYNLPFSIALPNQSLPTAEPVR